jgi:H+-transporting ATPase
MSEAAAIDAEGNQIRIVKGAFAVVAPIAESSPPAAAMVEDLQARGFRVLVIVLAFCLDAVKVMLFRRLAIA